VCSFSLYASELAKPSVNFLIVPGSNWALLCGAAVNHSELKTKSQNSWPGHRTSLARHFTAGKTSAIHQLVFSFIPVNSSSRTYVLRFSIDGGVTHFSCAVTLTSSMKTNTSQSNVTTNDVFFFFCRISLCNS